MLCKSCHYPLKQLSEPRCPECGREFDPDNSNTYFVPPDRKSRRWLKLLILGGLLYLGVFMLILPRVLAPPNVSVVNNVPGVTLTLVPETLPWKLLRAAIISIVYWPVVFVVALLASICLRGAISSLMLRVRLARRP